MSDVKAGKYTAKIVDADVWASTKNEPRAVLVFDFMNEEGNPRQLMWFGSLNGGAREITVETLVRCGFTGNDLADLNKGKEVLNEGPYEIVVEMNTYEGKTGPRIKYINAPGGGAFRERMQSADAVQLCSGLNLGADFMQARAKLGKKTSTPSAASKMTEPSFKEEDLPF